MTDQLIILFVDMFYKLESKGLDGFMLIKFSVPSKILYELYERLTLVDVPKIETLPEDEKLVFWDKAKTFHTDKEQCIIGSKAAYILSLITNN